MGHLIRVVGVQNGNNEYISSVISYYKNMHENSIPEYMPEKVIYDDSGTATIPWKQATELMKAQIAVKKRLECGQ